jgi:hypothetical protein
MALTPAQRKAKLEAAKALMNEVEVDETATENPPPAPASGQAKQAAPAPGLMASFFPHKSGAPDRAKAATAAPAVVPPVTAAATAAAAVAPAATTPAAPTPHSIQTAAGKPSLFDTLVSVAKLGFGKTQKG